MRGAHNGGGRAVSYAECAEAARARFAKNGVTPTEDDVQELAMSYLTRNRTAAPAAHTPVRGTSVAAPGLLSQPRPSSPATGYMSPPPPRLAPTPPSSAAAAATQPVQVSRSRSDSNVLHTGAPVRAPPAVHSPRALRTDEDDDDMGILSSVSPLPTANSKRTRDTTSWSASDYNDDDGDDVDLATPAPSLRVHASANARLPALPPSPDMDDVADKVVALPACPHCARVPKQYMGHVGELTGLVTFSCPNKNCRMDPEAVNDDALHEQYCIAMMEWRIAGSKTRNALDIHNAGPESLWSSQTTSKSSSPSPQVEVRIRYFTCHVKTCAAAIRIKHQFPTGGRVEATNAVRVTFVGSHNHGASTQVHARTAALEQVRTNLRRGKSALRAFQEQTYWTTTSAIAAPVKLKSVQNMAQRIAAADGGGARVSRDEHQAVMDLLQHRDNTGVRDYRLARDGEACVIMMVCSPLHVSLAQMCELLPDGVPLALFCDGKWKLPRLSQAFQVVLLNVNFLGTTYTVAALATDVKCEADYAVLWQYVAAGIRDALAGRSVTVCTDAEPALFNAATKAFDGLHIPNNHMLCRVHAHKNVTDFGAKLVSTLDVGAYVPSGLSKYFESVWYKVLHCSTEAAYREKWEALERLWHDTQGVTFAKTFDDCATVLMPFMFAAKYGRPVDPDEKPTPEFCTAVRKVTVHIRPVVQQFLAHLAKLFNKYARSLCAFGLHPCLFDAGPRGTNNYAEAAGQRFSLAVGGTDTIASVSKLADELVKYLTVDDKRLRDACAHKRAEKDATAARLARKHSAGVAQSHASARKASRQARVEPADDEPDVAVGASDVDDDVQGADGDVGDDEGDVGGDVGDVSDRVAAADDERKNVDGAGSDADYQARVSSDSYACGSGTERRTGAPRHAARPGRTRSPCHASGRSEAARTRRARRGGRYG